MRVVYNEFRRPPIEDCMEKPDPTKVLETTGYERIEKTVNRLMRAGLNLYMTNRNIDKEEIEEIEDGPMSVSKFSDVKDVNMYMREIQARLKRKAMRDSQVVKEEENPEVVETPKEE